MEISKEVEDLLTKVAIYAQVEHHEYVTPEHVLYVLTGYPVFEESFGRCGGDIDELKKNLEQYFRDNMDYSQEPNVRLSSGLNQVLAEAEGQAASCERYVVEISHLVGCIMNHRESYGAYFILSQGVEPAELLYEMSELETEREGHLRLEEEEEREKEDQKRKRVLEQFTVCLNDEVKNCNPLIGREAELERTIQVLCRRDKNNPLHIGEPGVGKTAIAYGLAARIKEGRVPEKLSGAVIYSVDLGAMLAGAQYRGDFEKRFKQLMEEIQRLAKPILYFDEIHNIVGAGAVGGSSLDASNLLKPYLSGGKIRIIGATTYEEYKKYFSKSKSLVRRFQNIDIKEPTIEEAITILDGLKPYYEKFHQVRYGKGVIEHTVRLADKYINERFLPDKAIDLLDEAGAHRVLHPLLKKMQTVDKKTVEEVLSKICRIPKQNMETDEIRKLSTLEKRMKQRVFGQDEAVAQLANGVKFSGAGLNDPGKPLGSYLFAGPTGVGKTELAKCLADLLGIPLIRFDMSEYAEKHTVAKLIGSPAGYVGYEEGGLLTEAVRRQPHSVLLLDEIEKAHSDIYNVLLQIMDYATLTDNQGRKADFKNVILVMTSNAGAGNIGKSIPGFGGGHRGEEAVMEEVKKAFSPEFRNRLDRMITFHALDDSMAEKIVEKQIGLLADRLSEKKINLRATGELKAYLREKGAGTEYGAREILRLMNQELKPLLVDEILFGRLKRGGNCLADYQEGRVCIRA